MLFGAVYLRIFVSISSLYKLDYSLDKSHYLPAVSSNVYQFTFVFVRQPQVTVGIIAYHSRSVDLSLCIWDSLVFILSASFL